MKNALPLPCRQRLQRQLVLLALLVVGVALAGCGATSANTSGESAPADDGHDHTPAPITARYTGSYPIRVVATTGMVGDLAHHIGGSHVQVVPLMGAGVDPHLYKGSPSDVAELGRADVVFYSGLHLEGKLAELLERMGRRKPTVAVAEGIAPEKLLADEHGARDPHVWFDVSLWSEAAFAVRDALSQFDPTHASDYEKNAAAYRKRLDELHAYVKEQLTTIPDDRRVLITAHDAFRYFGRAYGIEVRGIQGISTDSEAGVRQVNELVDFLVERKIKAVFVETSVGDQNVRSLLEGCAAQNHTVEIGGELFSDAMGAAGSPEGTYEGMVRHNVDTIVKALQ